VFDQWTIEKVIPPTSTEPATTTSVRLRRLGEERKPLTPAKDTFV